MTRQELLFWIERIGRWERQGLTAIGHLPSDPNPFPKMRLFR